MDERAVKGNLYPRKILSVAVPFISLDEMHLDENKDVREKL